MTTVNKLPNYIFNRKAITNKRQPFVTRNKKEFTELEELPQQEQKLVLGIAKLATWTHKTPDTARESVDNF